MLVSDAIEGFHCWLGWKIDQRSTSHFAKPGSDCKPSNALLCAIEAIVKSKPKLMMRCGCAENLHNWMWRRLNSEHESKSKASSIHNISVWMHQLQQHQPSVSLKWSNNEVINFSNGQIPKIYTIWLKLYESTSELIPSDESLLLL